MQSASLLIESFHHEFGKIIESYAGKNSRVYVFVDDLDRCETPKAAELLQALNLMISDESKVYYCLGMDKKTVAAAISAKHKTVIQILGLNDLTYGHNFIEKFIQLPFKVPIPHEDTCVSLSNHQQLNKEQVGENELDCGEGSKNDKSLKELKKIEKAVFLALDSNPRRFKQFINQFRFQRTIGSRTKLFAKMGGRQKSEEEWEEYTWNCKKLAKYIAISIMWPPLISDLSSDITFLGQLQDIAIGPEKAAEEKNKLEGERKPKEKLEGEKEKELEGEEKKKLEEEKEKKLEEEKEKKLEEEKELEVEEKKKLEGEKEKKLEEKKEQKLEEKKEQKLEEEKELKGEEKKKLEEEKKKKLEEWTKDRKLIELLREGCVEGGKLSANYKEYTLSSLDFSKLLKISPEVASSVPLLVIVGNIEFVRISVGVFEMGSPNDEIGRTSNEGPIHEVIIKNSFYMGKYPVTQKQWIAVMGYNPSKFKGEDRPVENVSWNDVQEFIKKLNEKDSTGKYRLPSEAEWEYACRAGTTTRYSFGDEESKLGDYAWYYKNSGSETHPVGLKKPNALGSL